MSRYSGRRSDADLAYGDLPSTDRWDRGRFEREGQHRSAAPVIEERPPYRSSRGGGGAYEEDRIYEHERESGPRGTRDRRYFEEDDYYDPRAGQGAMIPFRPAPARPPRPAGPPRPGMIRRQSSVDRIEFDRRSSRRYEDDYYRPPPPPPREPRPTSRYDIKIYDDVKVQDPDRYGDDGFREYREREWTRSRTRNDDPSPDRRAPTEIIDARPGPEFEEIIEEKKTVIEKPYPRRGKTRMPKRLVHTKVLFDLGYPYYEEDDKTIIIEKALGPENIDEVFGQSKIYRERETVTTRLIEAPVPAPASHKSISEAPRSVREWDNFAMERDISPGSSVSQSTRKSRRSRSAHQSVHESIHEDDRFSRHGNSVHGSVHKSIHRDRSISPAQTHRSRKSRARSRATSRSRASLSSDDTTIIEKKIIREGNYDDSATVDLNFPLSSALVASRGPSRTDADIKREIRDLERERRDIRRDTEIVSPRGEIIVADRRDGDFVAVRKDKRARSRSRPPGAGLLKSMMYTVT